jgi:hypothetical protein
MARYVVTETEVNIEFSEVVISAGAFTSVKLSEIDKSKCINVIFNERSVFSSEGIVDWLTWTAKIAPNLKSSLVMHQCPVGLVRQFRTISNLLPSFARVESFYVPFFSEATQEFSQILLKHGLHFGEDFLKLPMPKDSVGNDMELDINSNTYFSFLNIVR